MNAQIFLIAPMDATLESFPQRLDTALKGGSVAAMLLPRGERDEAAYEALATALLPVAQDNGCALLLDNTPELAKKLGADGVHMTSGIKVFRDAVDTLQPDMIVGAGDVHSTHDAMTKGEAGADYVFFGNLTGETDPEAREAATWWAQTFEIPGVFCAPEVELNETDAVGCEFLGVSDKVWEAENPNAAIATVAARLGAPT